MKRLIMLLLCAVVLLCACGNENVPEQPAAEPTEQVADATEPTFHARSHTLTEIRHRPPSEEEDGNYLYYRCNDCGALFWDFTGRTPATLEEVIVPALGRRKNISVIWMLWNRGRSQRMMFARSMVCFLFWI